MQLSFEVNIDTLDDLISVVRKLPTYCVTTRLPAEKVQSLLDKEGRSVTFLIGEISEFGRTVRLDGQSACFDRVELGSVHTMTKCWNRLG